jgi:hypothetical protein
MMPLLLIEGRKLTRDELRDPRKSTIEIDWVSIRLR